MAAAVRLDPHDYDYVSDLAQAQYTQGKFAEAALTLSIFVEAHPDHDRGPETRARLTLLRRRATEGGKS
jgi:hypothetical protein